MHEICSNAREMNLQQLLASLSARKFLALSVLAFTVFSTLLVNLVTTKSFTASTEITVNHESIGPVTGMTVPAYLVPRYMATQADIISSHRMALQVVDALGLARDSTVVDKFDRSIKRRGDIRSWLADVLLQNLEVEPLRDSSVIRISYSGADPVFAAAVSDAFAEAYLHLAIDLNGLKADLDTAQEKLATFQREKELAAIARKSALEAFKQAEFAGTLFEAQLQPSALPASQESAQADLARAEAASAELAQSESNARASPAMQESANEQEAILGLKHDVEDARKVLDVTAQYFGQTSLEGRSSHPHVAILKHAVPPAAPSKPKMFVNLSVSVLLGMALAVGSALIAERNNTRVRRPEDFTLGLELPVLGALARVKRKRKSWLSRFFPHRRTEHTSDTAAKSGWAAQRLIRPAMQRQFSTVPLFTGTKLLHPEVVAAIRPNDQKVESLSELRSQIVSQWYGEHRSMVITAPSGGAGVSHVAANLAVVFAQFGSRTLLIDADLHYPRQHTLFRLSNHLGLSDILAGRAGIEAVQRIDGLQGVFVLTAGTPTPYPHELFAGAELKNLLNEVEKNYDIVIFDSPPVRMHGEAQMLSALVGGALIVARAHHTLIADVKELKRRLDDAGAQAVGVLFNSF